MKRIGILLLALATSPALALEGTTRDGFPACRSLQHMEDFVGFMMDGDTDSMKRYMVMDMCFSLNGGLIIEVPPGDALALDKTVEFTHQGKRYWTIHEAIRH